MRYNPAIHHRRSIRLKGYDYTRAGAYYVTMVTKNRECVLGEIVNDEMRLNEWGECVADWWDDIPQHFMHADIDAFIIMPNHVHGILVITDTVNVGAGFPRPDLDTPTPPGAATAPLRFLKRPTLGQIVGYFKYQSTKQINDARNTPGVPIWHRNYYEHIIRNEHKLERIRVYIANNPRQWALDAENPSAEKPSAKNPARVKP